MKLNNEKERNTSIGRKKIIMDLEQLERKEKELEQRIRKIEKIENELIKRMKAIEKTIHIKTPPKKRYALLETLERNREVMKKKKISQKKALFPLEKEVKKPEERREILRKQLLSILQKKEETKEKKGEIEDEANKVKEIILGKEGEESKEKKRKDIMRKGIEEILKKTQTEGKKETEEEISVLREKEKVKMSPPSIDKKREEGGVDDARQLLKILLKRGVMRMDDAAKEIGVKKEKVKEWVQDLQEIGIIEVIENPWGVNLKLKSVDVAVKKERKNK
jgi:hypothetical protein